MAVCSGLILAVAVLPSLDAMAASRASGTTVPAPGPRIALYGDSLVSEAGPEFAALGQLSGASVRVHTFPGTSPCDYFSSMTAAVQGWHPTVALLAFSGNTFTACDDGVQVGTPPYYAKYKDEIRTAISIFRSVGAKVILVGLPADASARLTRNARALNQLYRSIAQASTGVTFDDAGRAVTTKGRFTWRLPCLSGEPCTGPHGTNTVRAPDGVHFCPVEKAAAAGIIGPCPVYSSGAYRYALAMVGALSVLPGGHGSMAPCPGCPSATRSPPISATSSG